MTPEARARIKIDAMLVAAGWIVQHRDELNLHAGPGVAVREVPTPTGPADYVLFLDRKACAVLEAKPEGVTLLGTGPQGADYAAHAPSGYPHWGDPLPFTYLSTGSETLFRDGGDPVPGPDACSPSTVPKPSVTASVQPTASVPAWATCRRWTPRACAPARPRRSRGWSVELH
jgi:type I site-specific restriction endonuclease